MSRTKYLKGPCQHCGVNIEFPAEAIGTIAPCPACGKDTELVLAAPPEAPAVPRRVLIWTISGIAILLLGLAATLVGLKRAEKWAARRHPQAEAAGPGTNSQRQPAPPAEDLTAQNDFLMTPVELTKTPGSSLVYAVGVVSNSLSKQRFGVRVELELLDGAGQKVGTARDYLSVLEPNGRWRFKALVVESKAASAKLASIQEQP